MKDEIIERLNASRRRNNFKKKFGIFIDGQPVYLSTKNIYAGIGIAKRIILDKTFSRYTYGLTQEQRIHLDKERMQALEELITQGLIEIREL